ncbi:MAG: acylphosphatase [Jatrophihabitans sp.]
MSDLARLRAIVSGDVQGVGFRQWVRRTAGPLGLAGSAINLVDGRVEIDVEGGRGACEELLSTLRIGRTPGWVSGVDVEASAVPTGVTGFRIA